MPPAAEMLALSRGHGEVLSLVSIQSARCFSALLTVQFAREVQQGEVGADVAVAGFGELFFRLRFFLFGLDFVHVVAHADLTAQADGFEFGVAGSEQLFLCLDLCLLAAQGGVSLAHLQAHAGFFVFKFGIFLCSGFFLLADAARDFTTAVKGDGELHTDISAFVAAAAVVTAGIGDVVAVILVTGGKAELRLMAAFGGRDVGVAFFAFLCADTDGSAVRERLFFPFFLAGDGEVVGQCFASEAFEATGVKAGEVGEAIFGDGKLGLQAGFFGASAVVARLGFVGINDGGFAGLKQRFGLADLQLVGIFFGGDGGEFVASGEGFEASFANIQQKFAGGVVKLAIAEAGGDLFGAPGIPAGTVVQRLADLYVPAVALVFIVGVLGAVAVVGVGRDLRQQAGFRLGLRLLGSIACVAGGVVLRGMDTCSCPGLVQIVRTCSLSQPLL